jgi:hypothetical protein
MYTRGATKLELLFIRVGYKVVITKQFRDLSVFRIYKMVAVTFTHLKPEYISDLFIRKSWNNFKIFGMYII